MSLIEGEISYGELAELLCGATADPKLKDPNIILFVRTKPSHLAYGEAIQTTLTEIYVDSEPQEIKRQEFYAAISEHTNTRLLPAMKPILEQAKQRRFGTIYVRDSYVPGTDEKQVEATLVPPCTVTY